MDQNASANVQGVQSNPAPAPQASVANDTNVSTPAGAPTTGTAPVTDPGAGDSKPSFDPEIQKFLDNQNIKTDDLSAAVTELAKRNMKLRGNQSEPQTVAEVLNPKPVQATPEPAPIQKTEPEPRPSQPQHTLSDMDIANVSLFVKQQYPSVTTDAKFYTDMIADGFKPTTADGQINLKSVMAYAAFKQKYADAEKAIADNQPKANQIPQPSNTVEYAQVDQVQTMTEQAAQNIVLFSNAEKRFGRPIHPQYNEAVKFLQDIARK